MVGKFKKNSFLYYVHQLSISGSIMIVAWLLLATNGIIFARYYKHLLPKTKPCGIQIWFHLHRTLMVSVLVLNIAGLIVILFDLNWNWVNPDRKVEFTHSIFGILVVILTVVQVYLHIVVVVEMLKLMFCIGFSWYASL
jgi:hypothetical protein